MGRHVSRRVAILLATLTLALGIPLGIVIASHQYGDVPDSNPFHADITAITNAGVTSGCGGGNYCPDRNVTRAEMAAFMNRLGALHPSKTPVVNATKVDGIDSTNLLPGGVLPGGSTLRGTYAIEFQAAGAGHRGISAIPFGYTLGSAPTEHFIASGAPAPAACPGSASMPDANPGHLCVWEVFSLNVSGFCIAQTGATYLCNNAEAYGAAVYVTSAAAGRTASVGSWAVTAPIGFAVTKPQPAVEPCAPAPNC